MSGRTAIIDYGTGNLRSVWRALNRAGVAAEVASDADVILSADKIILPGVGSFARAMSSLRRSGLIEPLTTAALDKKVPILGICLGLQLMANRSEEGRVTGLQWLDADVVKFRPRDGMRYKVPYMGWNGIDKKRESRLLAGVNGTSEFYFLHSYHLEIRDPEAVVAETTYESTFASAVEKDNLFGVQFHPERSHAWGEQVLRNFVRL